MSQKKNLKDKKSWEVVGVAPSLIIPGRMGGGLLGTQCSPEPRPALSLSGRVAGRTLLHCQFYIETMTMGV